MYTCKSCSHTQDEAGMCPSCNVELTCTTCDHAQCQCNDGEQGEQPKACSCESGVCSCK